MNHPYKNKDTGKRDNREATHDLEIAKAAFAQSGKEIKQIEIGVSGQAGKPTDRFFRARRV